MALDPDTERAIREITDELRELTMVMRQLGRTMSALGDTEINAFAGKTKRAGEEVEDLGKEAKKSAGLVDQYGREIKSATRATEEATEATEQDTKATEEAAKAKRQLTREEFVYRRVQRSAFRDLTEEFSTTRGATSRLQEGLLGVWKGSEHLQGGVLLLESLFRGLGKATVSLTRDIYAGQRGAAVSARAFNALAKEVGTAAQGVGMALAAFSLLGAFVPQIRLFGVTLGAVKKGFAALAGVLALFGITLKAAAELNEEAAKQNDQLFKGFNELSRAGVGVMGGLDGLFDSLQRAGMSVAEIEQFTSFLAANNKQLALLGATTGEAARRFGDVAGQLRKSDLGEQLEMLGIQAEEQRELTMGYMAQQARLGRLENRSTLELVSSSAKFVRELDLMAQLTGTTRKEQMEILERQQTDERYRAALFAARARGDQAEIDRLEKAGKLAAALDALGMKALATGTRQIAAGRGVMATPETTAAEMTLGVTQVLNSQAPLMESLTRLMDQGRISQTQYADINAILGTIPNIQGPIIEFMEGLDRFRSAAETAAKMGMPLEKFLEQQQRDREQGDKSLQQNVQAARMQQNAAQIMDSVMRTFNISADVHKAASSTFQTAVNTFAKTVNAMPVAGGLASVGGTTPGQASSSRSSSRNSRRRRRSNAPSTMPLSLDQALDFQGGLSGNRENFDRLSPEFRDRILRMAQDYTREMGRPMPFYSGHRTAEQNQAVGGAPDSRHLRGRAADLGRATVTDLKKLGLLDKYGLKAGSSGSHVSDDGMEMGGIVRRQRGGQRVTIGEGRLNEAVVPLPDGKSIPVSLAGPLDRFQSQLADLQMPAAVAAAVAESRTADTAPRQQIDMMSAQLSRLDEVVAVMRSQLGVSQRILQVSQG